MRYAIVAGNGTTSRNNIEALIDDYFYIPDKNVMLIVPFTSEPSDGQVFAAQYAHERNVEVIYYVTQSASMRTLPKGTLHESADPYKECFEHLGNESAKVFLLWEDEDPECLELLSHCYTFNVPACDLIHGLLPIEPNEDIHLLKKPVMPAAEELKQVEEDQEFEETDEDDDDDDTAVLTEADTLYEAVELIANIFADAIVAKLSEIIKVREA